jgi:hypothetical protein
VAQDMSDLNIGVHIQIWICGHIIWHILLPGRFDDGLWRFFFCKKARLGMGKEKTSTSFFTFGEWMI